MLDLKKIKDLVRLMVDNDLAEISLRDGAEEVNLKRRGLGEPAVQVVSAAPAEAASSAAGDEPTASADAANDGLIPICSPMVGTFYAAQSPEAPPFIQVGTQVGPDTVVCILEAMKVFNEIKAEVSGVVEKVLAQNEDAVEYGQELFLVRPAG
ncbi:MAG: acetyl-CoA carboxylase biotin carboxyl carrier protein [Gemmatimonadetes bacterium]|nr:acetyl-CoA carboxylase biotin carboxyl carrier protein [Gemmatimonadota bacterium]